MISRKIIVSITVCFFVFFSSIAFSQTGNSDSLIRQYYNDYKKEKEENTKLVCENEKLNDKIKELEDKITELNKEIETLKTKHSKKPPVKHHENGMTFYEMGLMEEALREFENEIKLNPNNANSYKKILQIAGKNYLNAIRYEIKGLRNKAIDELIIAIKNNNDYAKIKLNELESSKY